MRFYRRLLLVATLLAFAVIALGAYVRLSDAGLGCRTGRDAMATGWAFRMRHMSNRPPE